MSPSHRSPRLPAFLGGLIWIGFYLGLILFNPGQPGSLELLISLSIALMAYALVGLVRRGILGRNGKAGAGLLLAGMGLVFIEITLSAVSGADSVIYLRIAGQVLTGLGLFGFGIGSLFEGGAAGWKLLPILMAPVYFSSWVLTGVNLPAWAPQQAAHWLAVAYGAGWTLLGPLFPAGEPPHF